MKQMTIGSSLFILITFFSLSQGYADPVTFSYGGKVTRATMGGNPAFDALVGQKVQIKYTFNPDFSDLNPNPTIGEYRLLELSVTLGDHFYSATTFRSIVILNEPIPSAPADGYLIVGGPFKGPLIDGSALSSLQASFSDRTATIYSDDSLPRTPPDPQDFSGTIFTMGWFRNGERINAVVGDNNLQPIPEPSTMLLLGTGLAGLAAWRYRKSMNPPGGNQS